MKRLQRLLATLMGWSLVVLGLAAAGMPMAATASAASGGTQNMIRLPFLASQIDTLNPFESETIEAGQILGVEYMQLVEQVPPNGKLGPALAKSWTSSGDTWIFHLRPGLKWSDGTPLTAADVAWTYNEVMTKPTMAVSQGNVVEGIKSVTAVNSTTVKMVTNQPTAVNPGFGLSIVPEHIWSKLANPASFADASNVVGDGPFVLTKYETGTQATMAPNKYYYQGKPPSSGIVFINYKDADAEVLALKAGDVYSAGLEASQYNALKNAKGITRELSTPSWYMVLAVNPGTRTASGQAIGNGNPVLHDPVVRRAIRAAINQKELLQKIAGGYGSTGVSVIPPAMGDYFSETKPTVQSYNVKLANQLLDQAGYKMGPNGIRLDKSGKPIVLRLQYISEGSDWSEAASFLQPWLKAIGIQVTPEPTDPNTMFQSENTGNYDLIISGWQFTGDPDQALHFNLCSVLPVDAAGTDNSSQFNFCNSAYDKLYQEQHAAQNTAQRIKLIHQALDLQYESAAGDVLFYEDGLDAYRSDRLTDTISMQGSVLNTWSYAHLKIVSPNAAQGAPTGWIIGIIAVIVVLAGVAVLVTVRRRRTVGERE